MLGGFHFNDRRYADDDLTLGSIDPYQIFRIFHEIAHYEWETGKPADIAYMIDQSHNLKGKIEAMIQTVTTAQSLFARAAVVDRDRLAAHQQSCALIDAEECLKQAFFSNVEPVIRDWRRAKGFPGRSSLCFPRQRLPGAGHCREKRTSRTVRFKLRVGDGGTANASNKAAQGAAGRPSPGMEGMAGR